jgi:hypothetical protein
MRTVAGLIVVAVSAGLASAVEAQLVDTHADSTASGAVRDQTLSPGEYGGGAYNYAGGGSGFGGTVGAGRIYMDSDATNLYIGFQMGGALNDLAAILLDTRAGGYTDAGMNDNGDGGRRASTQQSINADDQYAPGFLPDFSVIIGNFGTVFFELKGDPDPINFLDFDGTSTQPFREYSIPLATLGLAPGANVDFFVAYIGDSGYGSNESIPAGPINAGPNPGFDTISAGYPTFDRFTVVPAPGGAALVGLGGLVALRRRRS